MGVFTATDVIEMGGPVQWALEEAKKKLVAGEVVTGVKQNHGRWFVQIGLPLAGAFSNHQGWDPSRNLFVEFWLDLGEEPRF